MDFMKSVSERMGSREQPEVSQKDFEQIKVDGFNEAEGNLKFYDCPKCKNKGFIMRVEFNEDTQEYYSAGSECSCMHIRRTMADAQKSGLGNYINMRIEDYKDLNQWQKNVKGKVVKYMGEDNDRWFVALGQSGSGKSMICSIIANDLLLNKNKKVLYVTWTDFISKLKRDMMGDNTNEVSDYLEEIKNVEVLYLDEILKKYNETDLKYLVEIINHRYINGLKTIISSERLVDELLDIDEATMGRMVEMSGEFLINIAKDRSKNYRLKGIM